MEAGLKGRVKHTALAAMSKKLFWQSHLLLIWFLREKHLQMLVVMSWSKTRSIKSAKGCQEILKTLLALSNYLHSLSYWFSHGGYESLLLPSNKEAGELMNPLNRRSFMQNVNSCWLKWIFKFSLFFLIADSPGLISHRPLCFCVGWIFLGHSSPPHTKGTGGEGMHFSATAQSLR